MFAVEGKISVILNMEKNSLQICELFCKTSVKTDFSAAEFNLFFFLSVFEICLK